MQKNLALFKARTLKFYLYILIGIATLLLSSCNREEDAPFSPPPVCADGSSPPCATQPAPVNPVNPVGEFFGVMNMDGRITPLSIIVEKNDKADTFIGVLQVNSGERLNMHCVVSNANQMTCSKSDIDTVVIMNGSINNNKYIGNIDFNMLTFNVIWQGSFDLTRL